MKKKILASLLAVCLFVGMAVPAFASATSTVAGDGSKVTAMEFLKKNYEIKQDDKIDFKKELRVFESKEKLVIDYQQINWELEGQDTNFQLAGSEVIAVNASGTATLVARDDQSNKVVAKTIIKAIPNPNRKHATSFKYSNQTEIKIPVGYNAEDFDFTVLPITTGNYWTEVNASNVSDKVIEDVGSALGLDDTVTYPEVREDIRASFSVEITQGSTHATKASTATLTFTNNDKKSTTVKVVGASIPKGTDDNNVIAKSFNNKKVTIDGISYTASVAKDSRYIVFKADTIGNQIAKVADIDLPVLTISETPVNVPVPVISDKVEGDVKTDEVTNKVYYMGIDADTNELKFKIPGAALRDLAVTTDANDEVPALDVTEYNVRKQITTVATMTDRDNNNPKTVTAKTNLTWVAAKAYSTIAISPNKTIEVGETFDLGATVKKGASNANVHGALNKSWTEEFYSESSDASDYAIVDEDGKVLGVAVGKNKISVTMENGATAYSTITVVAKGAGTKPAGDLSLANANPKLIVGGTYTIGVKNAVAGAKIEHTSPYDTKVATVDANGKITAVGVGTTKVVTDVDGVKLYTTVTVTAAPTVVPTPDEKPGTTPPQTGVNN